MQDVYPIIELLWSSSVIAAVQQFFGPAWLPFFLALTQLGTLQLTVVVVSLLLWWQGRGPAYFALGLSALSLAIALLLKSLVVVLRPHGPEITIYQPAFDSAFPSGHAAVAAGLWGAMAAWGLLPLTLAAAIVLGVMLSRLYLGVHFLGDVIVGGALGLALVAIVSWAYPRLKLAFAQRPPWQYGLPLGAAAVLWAIFVLPSASQGWDILGGILGLAIAIPLEARYVGYRPVAGRWQWQLVKTVTGLTTLGALIGAAIVVGQANAFISAGAYFLAVLWVFLIAPALYQRVEVPAAA